MYSADREAVKFYSRHNLLCGVEFCRTVDELLAREIREFRSPTDGETRMFYEIVIAPAYTAEGLAVLKGKSKTLRILEAPLRSPIGSSLRQISGAWSSCMFTGPLSVRSVCVVKA